MTHLLPRSTADWLFVVQLGGAGGLVIPQLVRNWHDANGVSMAFLIALLAFALLQFSLARSSYRAAPTRKAWQARFIFALWTVLITLNIGEIFLRGLYQWDFIDAIVLPVLAASMILVYVRARQRQRTFADPVTRGQLAMATRGIPQLFQGLKFALVGGAGFTGVAALVGNINIWIRLTHLFLTRQESRMEENRRWMLASEIVNAITWLFASLMWLAWRIGWFSV